MLVKMSLLYKVGLAVIVGTAGYIAYKWWNREKQAYVDLRLPKLEEIKERIDPKLYNELKEANSVSHYKMKLRTNNENADKLEKTLRENGLTVNSKITFSHSWILAEGSGPQFLKMLDYDFVSYLGEELVYQIPENENSQ